MLPQHTSVFVVSNSSWNSFSLLRKSLFLILYTLLAISCATWHTETEEKTVFIKKTEDQFQLYRHGAPFEIKGASSGGRFLEVLQHSGANTLRVYDTLQLGAVLDNAQQHNLAVIVDLPLPTFDPKGSFYSNRTKVDEAYRALQNTVHTYQNHPALLLWNLGNEINFPTHPKYTDFYTTYKMFVDFIHEADPNHPVTTSVSSNAIRTRILSIEWHCPQLDFISINVFGRLTAIKEDLNTIAWLWNGPYLISEWGNNGPWESDYTAWKAPIEETSTKKAAQCRERYLQDINDDKHRCLGSLLFYWGQKQERTPTWFSLFDRSGARSQTVLDMHQLWGHEQITTPAPEITYMLLDQKGARDNIIFRPGMLKNATLKYAHKDQDSLTTKWEILPENWAYTLGTTQYEPPSMNHLIQDQNTRQVSFITPKKEGAYRLFAYLYDGNGNFATTNTPFYILKSVHE